MGYMSKTQYVYFELPCTDSFLMLQLFVSYDDPEGNAWQYKAGTEYSSPHGQNGRHFADDVFICIFVNEKFCILIKISLKFVPKDPVDNNPALV